MKRKPARFYLHVNYLQEPRRRVWTVRTRGRNHYLTHVDVFVRVFTKFKGPRAQQPKAYLVGRGVLRIRRERPLLAGSRRHRQPDIVGEITPR